mgnify:CR=1 FL=1
MIEARNGSLEEFLQPTRKGDPDAPLSDAELEQSLRDGMADIEAITGETPTLVRPPSWSYDERQNVWLLCNAAVAGDVEQIEAGAMQKRVDGVKILAVHFDDDERGPLIQGRDRHVLLSSKLHLRKRNTIPRAMMRPPLSTSP